MPVEGQQVVEVKEEVAKPQAEGTGAPASTQQAPAAPKEDPKVSSHFASLSRKERKLVQEQQSLNQREAAIKAREEAIAAKEAEFNSEWEKDPISAATKRGLTYERWIDRVLNDGKPTAVDQASSTVKEEMAKLRKELADKEAKRAEEAQKAAEAENAKIIDEYKAEISEFVKTNAEKYELTALHKVDSLVYDTIAQYHAQTKKILSIAEACDLVEAYLEEQVMASVNTKKVKAKVAPQPKEEPKSPKEPASQSKTLNNNMTSNAPSFLPAQTEEERLKRAMAALDRAK